MTTISSPLDAHAPLEAALTALEGCLAALGEALRERDAGAIDRHAGALHGALSGAIACFGRAAQTGSVPAALRHRLAVAGGRVAAQRESLARATAALDRAIDALMPAPARAGALYDATGGARASRSGASVSA